MAVKYNIDSIVAVFPIIHARPLTPNRFNSNRHIQEGVQNL